jgi:hypothetical protein
MAFKNIEDCKKYLKQYYINNKEKLKEKHKKYYSNNKEKIEKVKKQYRKKNAHILNALKAKRKALKLKATPKFANLEKIKEIYKNCPKGYHVDHIVPLVNKNVCGLHVEWNLQYLTASANLSKSNKFIC